MGSEPESEETDVRNHMNRDVSQCMKQKTHVADSGVTREEAGG